MNRQRRTAIQKKDALNYFGGFRRVFLEAAKLSNF